MRPRSRRSRIGSIELDQWNSVWPHVSFLFFSLSLEWIKIDHGCIHGALNIGFESFRLNVDLEREPRHVLDSDGTVKEIRGGGFVVIEIYNFEERKKGFVRGEK